MDLCVILRSLDHDLKESDITAASDAIKLKALQQVRKISPGFWLLQFAQTEGEFVKSLLKNGTLTIPVAGAGLSNRSIDVRIETTDERAIATLLNNKDRSLPRSTNPQISGDMRSLSQRSQTFDNGETRSTTAPQDYRPTTNTGEEVPDLQSERRRSGSEMDTMRILRRKPQSVAELGDLEIITADEAENAVCNLGSERWDETIASRFSNVKYAKWKLRKPLADLMQLPEPSKMLSERIKSATIEVVWTFVVERSMLMNHEVAISVMYICASKEAELKAFEQCVSELFSVQTFFLEIAASDWTRFSEEMKEKFSDYVCAELDSPTQTCTFAVLSMYVSEVMQVFKDLKCQIGSKSTVIVSTDEETFRYIERFEIANVTKRCAELEVAIALSRNAIQLTGPKKKVAMAEQSMREVLSRVKRTWITFVTQSDSFLPTDARTKAENTHKCLFLSKCRTQFGPTPEPVEILYYRRSNLTLIVKIADVLEESADVICSFTDSSLGAKCDSSRSDLMKLAGEVVTDACCDSHVQPGSIMLTPSGELRNFKWIAHMSVNQAGGLDTEQSEFYAMAIVELVKKCGSESKTSFVMPIPPEFATSSVIRIMPQVAQLSARSEIQIIFANPIGSTAQVFTDKLCKELGIRSSRMFTDHSRAVFKRESLKVTTFPKGLKVTWGFGDLFNATADIIFLALNTKADLENVDNDAAEVLNKSGLEKSNLQKRLVSARSSFNLSKHFNKRSSRNPVVVPCESQQQSKFIGLAFLSLNDDANENAAKKITNLQKRIEEMLRSAVDKGCTSVAIPPVGYGKLQYPADVVAQALLSAFTKFDEENKKGTQINVTLLIPCNDAAMLLACRATLPEGQSLGLKVSPSACRFSKMPECLIDEDVDENEVRFKAKCGGKIVYLYDASILSHVVSADALVHTMPQMTLLSTTSRTLMRVMRLSNEQFMDEIAKAPDTNFVKCTVVHQEAIPYDFIIHINAVENFAASSSASALCNALSLCERYKLSSVTIPLAISGTNFMNLVSTIEEFCHNSQSSKFNTIKLVSSCRQSYGELLAMLRKRPRNLWEPITVNRKVSFCVVSDNNSEQNFARALVNVVCSRSVQQSNKEENNADLESFDSNRFVIFQKPIGEGNFGCVHRGVYMLNKVRFDAAVKKIRVQRTEVENLEDWFAQVETFRHPNLVRVFGFYGEAQQVLIATQFVDGLTLLSVLQTSRSNKREISPLQLADWMLQAVGGMAYLESKKAVHRCLAARNILLDSFERCILTDFALNEGLSNDYKVENIGNLFPERWYPPECLTGRKRSFCQNSDKWSYGVLLWETYSLGCEPYEELKVRNLTKLEFNRELLQFLTNGERLQRPQNCPDMIHDIMQKCWQYDPQRRSPFEYLKNLMEEQVRNGG